MRKLAIFAFSFSAAVMVCNRLSAREVWLIGAGICAALFLLALFALRGARRLTVCLLCGGLALGFGWTRAYDAIFFAPARELDDQTLRLTATVRDYPQETDYGWKVSARMEGTNILLFTDEQGAELRPGDEISTIAHMTLATQSFAGEDITYYTAKGIFLWGECYGRLEYTRPARIPLRCMGAEIAHELKNSIDRCFDDGAAALVQAVVTGSREKLTDRFTSSLERTGLSHTVAVSGMHLSCFAGILSMLLGRGRRSTAILVMLWAVFFSGVAGATPSVSRAAVMLILLEIAPMLYRQRDDMTALAFALMLLLIWNPFSAAHVGLQLSFASVAGIFLLGQRLQNYCVEKLQLTKKPKNLPERLGQDALRAVLSVLCTTAGAMVATTPLTALHFGTFSLIAPLSNLLSLWAVTGVFAGGLLVGGAGMLLPDLAELLALPVAALARYLEFFTQLLSDFTFSALSLDSAYYRAWLVFCYLVLAAAFLIKGKRRWLVPVCCVLVAFGGAVTMTAAELDPMRAAVTVLDVGQGQSVLVRMGGRLALVDCGGDSPDDPGDLAADYLQARGYDGVDILVLSHYHDDHANGIPQLLRRLKADTIFVPDVEPDSPLRAEILSLAEELSIPVQFVRTDTYITMDSGTITLYPPLNTAGGTNELGLTVLVSAGDFDTLIPGDMNGETEQALLTYADLPDTELLIAGHHGSAHSTAQELLDTASPELCVVSVGANNRYGHPDGKTLERLALAGAQIYRTDLHGTVEISPNNKEG